jgi:hypothetical protein
MPQLRFRSSRHKTVSTAQYPPNYYRELLAMLVQEAYVQETTRRMKKKNDAPVVRYSLTERGRQVLRASADAEIRLPVTAALRQREELDAQQRERYCQQLQPHIAPEQLQTMDLKHMRIYVQWIQLMAEAVTEDAARAEALESLEQLLVRWRDSKFSSPGTPEMISNAGLLQVAHFVGTELPGEVISLEKLRSILVASSPMNIQDINAPMELLQERLAQWVQKHQPPMKHSELDAPMVLARVPTHPPWPYAHAFSFVEYRCSLTWEATYKSYRRKPRAAEDLARPQNVPASVVRLHLFDALLHGRAVHLQHIGRTPIPRQQEWLKLRQAERRLHIQVTGDPETAGPHGGPLKLYDLIRPIVGDFLLDMMPGERSEIDRAMLQGWCNRVQWYLALRRAGYTPRFAPRPEDDMMPAPMSPFDEIKA